MLEAAFVLTLPLSVLVNVVAYYTAAYRGLPVSQAPWSTLVVLTVAAAVVQALLVTWALAHRRRRG